MKFTKKFKENAALVVLGVVLFWGLTNYDKFFRLLGVMIGVLKPVIFGCIIAFILNVPMSGIEKRLFKKPKKEKYAKTVETLKRPCSIVLTFLLCLGVVALHHFKQKLVLKNSPAQGTDLYACSLAYGPARLHRHIRKK